MVISRAPLSLALVVLAACASAPSDDVEPADVALDTLAAQARTCRPTTCRKASATCGTIADGCGGLLTCGTCPAGTTCGGGGVANQCGACTPTTCAAAGATCGTIADGCGGLLSCGTCVAPSTCGGGGVPNQCGGG